MAGLDDALHRLTSAEEDARAVLQAQKPPFPPDPELDALFKDFATRMPRSYAVPFVEHMQVAWSEPTRIGLFRSRSFVDRVRTETVIRTHGWSTLGETIGMSDEDTGASAWFGLAIAIDGAPWFAFQGTVRPDLTVGGHLRVHGEDCSAKLGRPTGPSLRAAIIANCNVRLILEGAPPRIVETPFSYASYPQPDPNPQDRLPAYLGEYLARLLFARGVRAP